MNTVDEHEAQKAPFRGSMGFPTIKTLIEAEGGKKEEANRLKQIEEKNEAAGDARCTYQPAS